MNIIETGTTIVFSDTIPEEKKRLMAAAKEPTPAKPKMLNRKEVAALLGVHIETVKRYTRNKLLHAVKFSKRAVRYSEQEILDFMEKGVAKNG